MGRWDDEMSTVKFYAPDLGAEPDSPFARDQDGKLIRPGYWMDFGDDSLVRVMTAGIGTRLTNDQKRAHMKDIERNHLIDQICVQEILHPDS